MKIFLPLVTLRAHLGYVEALLPCSSILGYISPKEPVPTFSTQDCCGKGFGDFQVRVEGEAAGTATQHY